MPKFCRLDLGQDIGAWHHPSLMPVIFRVKIFLLESKLDNVLRLLVNDCLGCSTGLGEGNRINQDVVTHAERIGSEVIERNETSLFSSGARPVEESS